ncbi:unnamed protein product [Parnassius mnemosyne]|uniref:Uncharacterized protein n=1 Tax=Parnassius mnemosyne TaxID=213953 RepID=A0AAV1KRX7_9NEOP
MSRKRAKYLVDLAKKEKNSLKSFDKNCEIPLHTEEREMAKRGCIEFHVQDEEILQLLMADNSDGEDDLQLDEEEQQFIAQDVENGIDVVEIKDYVQEPKN